MRDDEQGTQGTADGQRDGTSHVHPSGRGPVGRLLHGAEHAAEPVVEGVSAAIGAAASTINELPGMRIRRIRRLAQEPLPSLHELHPEVRRARPVVIGLRSIPVDQIAGTAVAGGDQRGADFLPLKPFRGKNWQARWQRLRKAQDALKILPPIDVEKYDGRYWVTDGHNRVALALYSNQPEIDASVVELVPPGGQRTEPIGTLEAEVDASRALRGLSLSEPSQDGSGDPG
jgi:hypothetical protein